MEERSQYLGKTGSAKVRGKSLELEVREGEKTEYKLSFVVCMTYIQSRILHFICNQITEKGQIWHLGEWREFILPSFLSIDPSALSFLFYNSWGQNKNKDFSFGNLNLIFHFCFPFQKLPKFWNLGSAPHPNPSDPNT